ncbi:hypothetical protein LJR039_007583 [Pseudorhodoferax sp. LjRoot39]
MKFDANTFAIVTMMLVPFLDQHPVGSAFLLCLLLAWPWRR